MILFIAWPWHNGKPVEEARAAPSLDEIPRRCPHCQSDSIVGHGLRRRPAHDQGHDWIWVRRGECNRCQRTFTFLPDWCMPYSPYTLMCRLKALEAYQRLRSAEAAAPVLLDADRVVDVSTVRRWLRQCRVAAACLSVRITMALPIDKVSPATTLAWVCQARECILPATDGSP